ncbi:MAG TPA: 5-formyltetrahydrofolate cyclo-ligase [Candidatus Acidoferrales bacterium]|nr:5-formyltetrahydrofolate cyclo-ligase [Candidatus Acidoferrales bacterium]
MRDQKRALRARLSLERDSVPATELAARSSIIQKKAIKLPLYLNAACVGLYSPLGNEVETRAIAEDALKRGKALFYPRVAAGAEIDFLRVANLEELRRGAYGILEPAAGAPITPGDVPRGIFFVPGVAFDLFGGRLGRGRGAYDRLLERWGDQGTFVGLAFEFQLVSRVPSDERDRRVHYIITERRVIDCAHADAAISKRTAGGST